MGVSFVYCYVSFCISYLVYCSVYYFVSCSFITWFDTLFILLFYIVLQIEAVIFSNF